MKFSIFISVAFLLNSFTAFAQKENTILMQPEKGKEYFYCFTDTKYLADEAGEKISELMQQRVLRIRCAKEQLEDKLQLKVKLLENRSVKPLETPLQLIDKQYPYIEGAHWKADRSSYSQLLFNVSFLFDFDLRTNEISLLNRADILLEVKKILRRKELSEEEIEKAIVVFNKLSIPWVTQLLNSIYRIPVEYESNVLGSQEYKTSLTSSDSVSNIIVQRLDKKPGLHSLNITYDQENSYLKEYNKINIDSLKSNRWTDNAQKTFLYNERNIHLSRIKDISDNRLAISGTIENTKYKKVTIAFLQYPYGYELRKESVFLDERNSFDFETEFKHPGLIILQFGEKRQSPILPRLMLYAEPGSSIEFREFGDSFPETIEFKGDFISVEKMLYEFQRKYDLFNLEGLDAQRGTSPRISFSKFETIVNDYRAFFEEYKAETDETAYEFVSREIEAWLFSQCLYFLNLDRGYLAAISGKSYQKDQYGFDQELIHSFMNNILFENIYNENGLFSRVLANDYLSYHIGKAIQIQTLHSYNLNLHKNIFILEPGNLAYYNFPLKIELGKFILSGQAYYSEIASHLKNIKNRLGIDYLAKDSLIQKRVKDYLELLILYCNNDEFIDALQDIKANYQNWEHPKFVPSTKFKNEQGEEVELSEFLGDKPTIFYVSDSWGRERYYFDKLAEENPDINFVMIMQGGNFDEWIEYLERAEPKTDQLLLINSESSLLDVFKRDRKHFVIYNKEGTRCGFTEDALEATKIAKDSLTLSKKQLNKSQLWLIILLLVITLTLIVLSWIVWKWRVRQKFRKEQRQRRLRELELTAIRSQMNPHFLFNSLNSVQNLVQQNKGREAHLYLSDFAGLIRKVLNNSEKEEVSLAEELEMINQYLNLEKLRFDFEFTISLDKNVDTHNTMVPSMLIQPFAENAIIHGLQNKEGDRMLRLEIVKEESGVKICIEDNGIGRAAAREISRVKNGKGTRLVEERLEILQEKNREKYELKIIDLNDHSGTRVEILIPEEL